MEIVKAEITDITNLVVLIDNAYRGEGSKLGWSSEAHLFTGNKRTDEESVKKLMNNPDAVFLKSVNEEGCIEGCVYLHKKDSRLYLGMLSVSPLAQAKGIGRKLLSAADDFAVNQHCTSIYMTVISERNELIEWYERNGYRKTGDTLPFPKDDRFGIPNRELKMLVLEKNIQ